MRRCLQPYPCKPPTPAVKATAELWFIPLFHEERQHPDLNSVLSAANNLSIIYLGLRWNLGSVVAIAEVTTHFHQLID